MLLRFLSKMLVSLSLLACTSVFAVPLVVNVAGVESYGEQGDSGNTVFTFNVGANSTITSVAYNVNLTANTPSWLSEIALNFTDSDQIDGVFFTPAFADTNPGTGDYADFADLVALGLSFNVGADGILRLEFFEDYDDFEGADGIWNFGTLTFGVTEAPGTAVPEPGTGVLLATGLALLGVASRRRRQRATGPAAQ